MTPKTRPHKPLLKTLFSTEEVREKQNSLDLLGRLFDPSFRAVPLWDREKGSKTFRRNRRFFENKFRKIKISKKLRNIFFGKFFRKIFGPAHTPEFEPITKSGPGPSPILAQFLAKN